MSRGKFRITAIDNSTGKSGAFTSLSNLAFHLRECCEFIFLVPNKELVKDLNSKGVTAFDIPFLEIQKSWRLLLYLPMLMINTFRVVKLMQKHEVKILHVNDIYNMVGVLMKLISPRKKLVQHVRLLPGSYASLLYPIWSRLVFLYADAVICVSEAVYRALPASHKKILIYDTLPLPKAVGVTAKNDTFTFLYPANFIRGKGQTYGIDAFVSVLQKVGNSQLIFIGGDLGKKKNRNYLNKLMLHVKELKLTDRVFFIDQPQNLEPFYQSAHVVLNFSESESFSMTCLESLLFGTPVIATRCGGPEEIIEHGVNGILVSNKDVKEMGEAMVKVYQDSALRAEMAKKTIIVNQKFSIQESSKKMNDLYMSILSC